VTLLTSAPVPTPDAPLPSDASLPSDAGRVVGTVVVRGVLDVSTVARVREQLAEALAVRPSQVVVDLSGCPFVDASALAVLLDAHRTASRWGGVLTLCGCSPRVLRLLSLTGLRRVFDLA
jgi:anti-anti-sigma factor